jgi:hypothetical protein
MDHKDSDINLSFEQSTVDWLAILAKQENKSVESFAKELILDALELREDLALSAIAEMRDREGVARVRHEDAWK